MLINQFFQAPITVDVSDCDPACLLTVVLGTSIAYSIALVWTGIILQGRSANDT